jgi:hypothetical protein
LNFWKWAKAEMTLGNLGGGLLWYCGRTTTFDGIRNSINRSRSISS